MIKKDFQKNQESKEGTVLRLVREFRKMSLKDVGAKLGMKVAEIDHLENGRRFYTEEELARFLDCYTLPKEDFALLVNTKVINKIMVNHFLIK